MSLAFQILNYLPGMDIEISYAMGLKGIFWHWAGKYGHLSQTRGHDSG